MKQIAVAFGAASFLALAGAVSAGQPLTSAQMDGVTAGGLAFGFTSAIGAGPNVITSTLVNATTVGTLVTPDPQAGSFYLVTAHVDTNANAIANAPTTEGGAGGGIFGGGQTAGTAVGNMFAITASGSQDAEGNVTNATSAMANAPGYMSAGFAANTSSAWSVLVPATASSASAAASSLDF